MRHEEFFQQIEHLKASWGHRTILLPVFYYDVATLSVQFLAPIEKVRELLPSSRMHPLRITPWHCVVSIAALEYRDSDIGPYNEVSIGIPIVLDKPSPVFVGTLHQVPAVPKVYIRHLPVTTEIARDAGVDFAGYPKFLANITFEREGTWVKCCLHEAGQHILTLTGRDGTLNSVPRSRMHPITMREGYMLRCELIVSERNQVSGRSSDDVRLELGEHPIAQELRSWNLGKVLGYQYAPQHQAILTPVMESFAL
jgi:hypothetical protein